MRAFYGDRYFAEYSPSGGYEETADHRVHDAAVRGELLSARTAPGALLEVGCASGYFLAEAQRRGYDCRGIEPSGSEAARARERTGVPVFAGVVEDADLADASVDVVCAWHVLEHIVRPVDTLRRLRGALRPGGTLLLEVPNADSRAARHHSERWLHLDLPHHVCQFTPGSLGAALADAGFADVELETVSGWTYALPAVRRTPRGVAAQAKDLAILRLPLGRPDASRHELLRAVARVPAAG